LIWKQGSRRVDWEGVIDYWNGVILKIFKFNHNIKNLELRNIKVGKNYWENLTFKILELKCTSLVNIKDLKYLDLALNNKINILSNFNIVNNLDLEIGTLCISSIEKSRGDNFGIGYNEIW